MTEYELIKYAIDHTDDDYSKRIINNLYAKMIEYENMVARYECTLVAMREQVNRVMRGL